MRGMNEMGKKFDAHKVGSWNDVVGITPKLKDGSTYEMLPSEINTVVLAIVSAADRLESPAVKAARKLVGY